MFSLLLLDRFLEFNWTWVLHFLDVQNIEVTETIDVNSLIFVEIGSPDISENRYCVILVIFLLKLNHIDSVSENIGVLNTPRKLLDFLHSNKPSKIVYLRLRIETIFLLT